MVKKRLRQEKYWEHNTNREGLVEYDFSDSFDEGQWVMWGVKKGKQGNMSLWYGDKLTFMYIFQANTGIQAS